MENEESVQYIVRHGERVAFFDEAGDLFVMRKATLVDRRQIFEVEKILKV